MLCSGTYSSGRFPQWLRRNLTTEQGLGSDNVLCVAQDGHGELLAGTDAGLFRFSDNAFLPVADDVLPTPVRRIVPLSDGSCVIAAGCAFYALHNHKTELLQSFDAAAVDYCRSRGLCWFLTENEICCIDPSDGGTWVRRPLEGGKGHALAVSETEIYIATDTGISVIHGKRREWKNILPLFTAIPDAAVHAMTFDSAGHLWIGTDSGAAIYDNTDLWLTAKELPMLPVNAVTCIRFASDGNVWFGSDVGMILLQRGKAKYFSAERWTPSNNVRDIAVSTDGETVFAATDRGIAMLSCCRMSLDEKEALFEDLIENYHVRHGFVSTRTIEQHDLSKGYIEISDNDGLWTSVYAAAQSLRYAVTGEHDALLKARRAIRATLLLKRITGIPGFTARAVRYPGETGYGNGHHEWSLSPDGSCEWRGETSSDEMTGHFFGDSLYYDLCADEAEKQEIRTALCAIMDHIVSNNFRLIDRDGLPTTWACWDPALLNHDDKWVFERGINSLELLAFLKVTHHISGDTKYSALYDAMIRRHHYALNAAHHKIKDAHICHIDDNLAFLAVFTLLRLETAPSIRALLLCGMEDHWQYERPERQPLFCMIHAAFTGRDTDLLEGIQSLREMPLDTVHYRTDNSLRKDLVYDTEQATWHEKPQLLHVLPYDERNVNRPDGSGFHPDSEESNRAQEPTYYLLPYWIARYYGLLQEEADS